MVESLATNSESNPLEAAVHFCGIWLITGAGAPQLTVQAPGDLRAECRRCLYGVWPPVKSHAKPGGGSGAIVRHSTKTSKRKTFGGRPKGRVRRRDVPARIHREVATRIRRRRNRLGISIRQLAEVTGLDRSHLTDLERGTPNLTIATLLRIVQALDTTIAELFRGLEVTAINQWDDKEINSARARVQTGVEAKALKRRRENSPQDRTQRR